MKNSIPSFIVCGLIFSLGMLLGPVILTNADAAQRKDDPPSTFLSGSARSEKVLKDIHATLLEMDKRVASIEEIMRKSQVKDDGSTSSTPRKR